MLSIVSLVFLSHLVLSQDISLSQYENLEKSNPYVLFSDQDLSPTTQNYPLLHKLIFVTPWNKNGYEFTLKYAKKFDYISPCWYDLITSETGEPKFQNQSNYNQSFVQSIRKINQHSKVVPRIFVSGDKSAVFQSIGSSKPNFRKAVNLISSLIISNNFDGIIWDSPYNFFEKNRHSLNILIVELLAAIRKKIPSQKQILFNMANPLNHMNSLDIECYQKLPIDALLIQNYDNRGKYLEMIQKSIQWKTKNLIKPELVLMLPYFSVLQTTGNSLSTNDAVSSLQSIGFGSSRFSEGICLYSSIKSLKRYYIPCYSYFKAVFQKASSAQAAVGFWEAGNGLENYFKFL